MKKMIKYELSRAFSTPGFKASMLIGAAVAVSHFLIEVLPLIYGRRGLEMFMQSDFSMKYPGWLYHMWLGGGVQSIQSSIYFLIFPLLAALPFADSFYADVSGGYFAEICTRKKREHYFAGKYVSVYLSGGVAALFPLVLSFLLCMTVIPALVPETTGGVERVYASTQFGELYYTLPFLFVLLHLLITFVFAGFFAVFALSVTYYCNYQFLTLISPFLIYLFLNALFGLLRQPAWQPNNFLNPCYSEFRLMPVLIIGAFLAVFSALFYFRGRRADVF